MEAFSDVLAPKVQLVKSVGLRDLYFRGMGGDRVHFLG